MDHQKLTAMVTAVVCAAAIAFGLVAVVWTRAAFSPRRSVYELYQRLGGVLGRKALPDYAKLTGVPAPRPLYNFDVDGAKPRPYRPFRWEYHQNMSLKRLEPDWWLELENTYRARIAQRTELYAKHGKLIIDELPGSRAASRECMEMVVQFLCQRYPNQFRYDNWTGVFTNEILGTTTDLAAVHPLRFLLDNVPEDFLVTQQHPQSGLYCLTAAVSGSAIGWNISQKIGRPLSQIHGPVPDYKEKMEFSMDRFFSKMPCHKPIQRGSWGLEIGEPLFLQTDEPEWSHRAHQDPNLPLSNIYLRVDWQTLRRLPKSRAIVFNFKALFTPVTDFRLEPCIPKLLLKVLVEGNESIMKYKGTWHIEHKVIPALKEWAEEQEKRGLVPENWKVRTLDEDPFFPGWRTTTPYGRRRSLGVYGGHKFIDHSP